MVWLSFILSFIIVWLLKNGRDWDFECYAFFLFFLKFSPFVFLIKKSLEHYLSVKKELEHDSWYYRAKSWEGGVCFALLSRMQARLGLNMTLIFARYVIKKIDWK